MSNRQDFWVRENSNLAFKTKSIQNSINFNESLLGRVVIDTEAKPCGFVSDVFFATDFSVTPKYIEISTLRSGLFSCDKVYIYPYDEIILRERDQLQLAVTRSCLENDSCYSLEHMGDATSMHNYFSYVDQADDDLLNDELDREDLKNVDTYFIL